MRVIDPGHKYALPHLDGDGEEILTFVKREGEGYPGNVGHYEGTNIQECLRALIDRVKYLHNQIPDTANFYVLDDLRSALRKLEIRAAFRHKRLRPIYDRQPENMIVCPKCLHIGCEGDCH